ncbi:peptide chain release factor N(5)-glutamine methyltransferase [Zhihengliuella sp.]|uniref:peptide chain release factor N(5)-glutamine methyltransferase n=1 Tax=Zhihengliuella sp. TaxID=1954483 RepID=UPI002811F2E6|nr:peptide chain release factor N(5)-glutamine methyltransferase [Zhihengliuella sp.]
MPAPGLDPFLRECAARLSAAGVPSPRADAELLAAHVLGVGRGRVGALRLAGHALADDDAERLAALVDERAARVPLQHLTGVAHFRHLELRVGPGVFVPRPETEALAGLAIDAAAAVIARRGSAVVVDLGTGSGAIAAAVASEVPAARVHAVELSEHAAAWAEQNLAPHGVDLRVGDLRTAFEDLDGTVDVVVSNPPYIPAGAVPVDPEVREHDPGLALYGGGADGMELPRAVERTAARLLVPGGLVALEHAEVQEEAMQEMFRGAGAWATIAGHRDLTGRPRCTSAVRREG